MVVIREKLAATVGKFPPPSLLCVIAELKREAAMREHVYPRLIDSGKLTEDQALYQQRCLEEAIDLLQGKMPAVDVGHVSAKPDPGEPYFTLLGRDLAAPQVVRSWAFLRRKQISEGAKPPTDDPKVKNALRIADSMEAYRRNRRTRLVQAPPREEYEPREEPV